MDRKELEKKAGKVTKELEDKITMMGTPGGFGPQVLGGRSLSLLGGRLNAARFVRATWRNKR